MLKLGQTVGVCGRLRSNDPSFIGRHRSLIAPRFGIWSVSLLRSNTTKYPAQMDVGMHHGVGKIKTSETKRYQTASQNTKKNPRNIQVAMDAAFGNASGGALGSKFDTFVDELLADCSKSDISNFMRIAGKRSRKNTASHMTRRLPDLSRKLDSMVSSEWSYREISNIFYGLQCCKESDDSYLTIMLTMSKIATRSAMRGEMIESQSLSMLLYGLRSNKFKQTESRKVLSCLHKIAVNCKERLSAQAVGNALYGLQGMSSDDADVRSLVRALSGQVARCSEPLSAQAVGNALYGLQGMSSDDADVRSLVRALSGQVARCSEPLDAQEIGNALYGLQGMSSDDADVRSLVRALSGQVARCSEPLSAQTVGNALYGLQGMSSFDEGRSLGMYLIRTYIDMNKRGVSATPNCISSSQSVVMVFPLLRDHLTDDEVKECERIISDIDFKSRVSDDGVNSPVNLRFQSRSEQRMHTAAMKALDGSKLRVSHNEHLFGLFECDIVVRVPRAVDTNSEGGSRGIGQGRDLDREQVREEQSLIINIEVDGVHHRREKKKRFCRLRDEYLQSRGVVIARIEISALDAMSEYEVEKWVLALID